MILESCQRALNRAIADSEAARAHLAELEGESLCVDVDGLGIRLNLTVADGELVLSFRRDAASRVSLRAAPLDLLKLARSGSAASIVGSDAEISGNPRIAEAFGDLFRSLDPDFEEELSQWTGDVAAHALGDMARASIAWARQAGAASEANLSEYLQQESEMLPSAYEVEALGGEIDRLRDAVDRAEQRLRQLSRIAGKRR